MSDQTSHDLAQQALARGDRVALELFDRLLTRDPGNARLWLGKAQALELCGDGRGARIVAEQIAAQAPGFLPALTYLAGLRLAAADRDFAAPFRTAATQVPSDPNIPAAHIEALAGADLPAQAASIAAEARRRFPAEPHFALLDAIHAGASGEWDRAEAIFADLKDESPQRHLHEARHRLRARDSLTAERLLQRALAVEPWDIAAWALLGIAWRLAGDSRAEWLHEQAGLVELIPLASGEELVAKASGALCRLHATSAMPLGQSLRGGTQTRGILFNRTEPILAALHDTIRATLETYRAGLPPLDETHPLLRHRKTPWKLAGSWSVRLKGGKGGAGDYHAAHIHPQGIISSALYLIVPEAAGDANKRHGWLEIGRPPRDLGLDLAPLRVIEPRRAHLALFPSTLYHGTIPLAGAGNPEAERLTVAFDVVNDLTPQPSALPTRGLAL